MFSSPRTQKATSSLARESRGGGQQRGIYPFFILLTQAILLREKKMATLEIKMFASQTGPSSTKLSDPLYILN